MNVLVKFINKKIFMSEFKEQIQRIKGKLLDAKKTDTKLKVFGAEKHKYKIGKPITQNEVLQFEHKYTIELPACYKTFVLNVGNGGISYADAGVGPYYGIYPFGTKVNEFIYDYPEKYLKNECVIYPKMTDEFWKSLTKNIDENEIMSNEEFDKETGKIFGGILPLGTQGCTYFHGLVLTGKYKGRVVNLDLERQKPYFSFDKNFLDWYERWLDLILSGELLKNVPTTFGYEEG
jgi:prolyl-tRNA editing enzyme YbaK/EbsC (Cys-tRNA(Pro) deacylase)